jgi:hypothetical protein
VALRVAHLVHPELLVDRLLQAYIARPAATHRRCHLLLLYTAHYNLPAQAGLGSATPQGPAAAVVGSAVAARQSCIKEGPPYMPLVQWRLLKVGWAADEVAAGSTPLQQCLIPACGQGNLGERACLGGRCSSICCVPLSDSSSNGALMWLGVRKLLGVCRGVAARPARRGLPERFGRSPAACAALGGVCGGLHAKPTCLKRCSKSCLRHARQHAGAHG